MHVRALSLVKDFLLTFEITSGAQRFAMIQHPQISKKLCQMHVQEDTQSQNAQQLTLQSLMGSIFFLSFCLDH